MKNTTPDAAVLQELKELTSRIFKICEQNNMPVVIGYSYELNRNEDGYSINKSITAYADEKTGAWDSTVAVHKKRERDPKKMRHHVVSHLT
ncbi:TPA: hypothetical protein ACT3PT_003700 [Salmonella enterica]|uniref:hypothetical protein n=1 Tax=Salmonella enterica TaxID=28901 RepID=UPI003FD872AD